MVKEFSTALKIRIPRNKKLDAILIDNPNKIVVRRSTVAGNRQDYFRLNDNIRTVKKKNTSNKSKPFTLTGRIRKPGKN